jgi:hypothetical protein
VHQHAEIVATQGGVSCLNLFDPAARSIYEAILAVVTAFGDVTAEEKKTSVHLVGAKSAFAGVHPRKGAVVLNIRSAAPIKSNRIRKLEQVSAKRFHNEMLIDSPAGVDGEVVGWLKAAHALSAVPSTEKTVPSKAT